MGCDETGFLGYAGAGLVGCVGIGLECLVVAGCVGIGLVGYIGIGLECLLVTGCVGAGLAGAGLLGCVGIGLECLVVTGCVGTGCEGGVRKSSEVSTLSCLGGVSTACVGGEGAQLMDVLNTGWVIVPSIKTCVRKYFEKSY